MRNSKPLGLFVCFFALGIERILIKTQMRYWTGKYTVCRCARASFSPEIVQAAAVKGLSVVVDVDGTVTVVVHCLHPDTLLCELFTMDCLNICWW